MSHDINDADVHLSDYHRQLFSRANRYYEAVATGSSPRRRRRSWPVVTAFTLGAALSFLVASLVLPTTAAALPDKLASAARPVEVSAAALSRQNASYKAQVVRDATQAQARAEAARRARIHAALVLASEDANPLRAIPGLVAERVDAGVDFGGYGPVYALGPGTIYATYNSGWPGGGWICELMTGGPHAGMWVYTAEAISPSVVIGEHVTSATVLGTMQGYIETGWAQPGCAGNALAGYYGIPSPEGYSYDSVLRGLGVPPPFTTVGAGPLDTGPPTGSPSAHHHCGWRCYPRNRAMNWALHQKGCWYNYGGTSCAQGFDCSGLVMMAYASIGIHLPRTTYDMLADVGVRHYRRHSWWVLVQVRHPRRGDLAFYGSGHVELDTKLHDTTFGAHDSGTQVGYAKWSGWWAPTAFYRVEVHRRH